jgi:hypothetical protein
MVTFEQLQIGSSFINTQGNVTIILQLHKDSVDLKSSKGTEWNVSKKDFNYRVIIGCYVKFKNLKPLHENSCDEIKSNKTKFIPLKGKYKVKNTNNELYNTLLTLGYYKFNMINPKDYIYYYLYDDVIRVGNGINNFFNSNDLEININQILNYNKNEKTRIIKPEQRAKKSSSIKFSTPRIQSAIGSRPIGNTTSGKFKATRIITSQIRRTILSF